MYVGVSLARHFLFLYEDLPAARLFVVRGAVTNEPVHVHSFRESLDANSHARAELVVGGDVLLVLLVRGVRVLGLLEKTIVSSARGVVVGCAW